MLFSPGSKLALLYHKPGTAVQETPEANLFIAAGYLALRDRRKA
jgi:hypothetical protein